MKTRDRDGAWSGLPGVFVHVYDKTRGQAKAEILGRLLDAGYRAKFTEISVRPCIVAGTIWCRRAFKLEEEVRT